MERPTESAAMAAVLAPVFRDGEGRLRLVLIVRVDHGPHGGQVALPGGRVDERDENPTAAAVREAREEIGLDPAAVRLIAELPVVRSNSTNLDVHPFLARIPDDLAWQPNAQEVLEVLTPTLSELWDPALRGKHLFTSARWPAGLLVTGIRVGDTVLWGMTLRILDHVVPLLLEGEWATELS